MAPKFRSAILLFAALVVTSPARAQSASPGPSCTPPRGTDPALLPPPPAEPPATGTVRVDPRLRTIIVDGWSCPLISGTVAITCGEHVIKSRIEPDDAEKQIQTVDVPCGRSVWLGHKKDVDLIIGGVTLIVIGVGLVFTGAIAALVAGLPKSHTGESPSYAPAAFIAGVGGVFIIGGGIFAGLGSRKVPTVAIDAPRVPTGLASAHIAIGDRAVGLGFSF